MSIPVLTQVYDEVRRLAIAGSAVAGGDFRLKKVVAPLEQAGQKAPVFAKVAQAVAKVVDSSEKSSPEALLELSTLINAILYTQGETGLAGNLEPIETTDLGQHQTQASARVLKPLLEALSTTGSGRLEIIKEAHQGGAFRDLRLVKPALDALDDRYPEIGDFIANEVLPLYGKSILPELRARFDHKGRGGDVRRLALLHQLDPEGSRETVKIALDEGSKEVKVVAIECLGSSQDDLSLLLGHVKSKAKDVRQAALKAIAASNADEAVEVLQAAIQGDDVELMIPQIRTHQSAHLLKFLVNKTRECFAALLAAKKDRAAAGKHASRMTCLLECLRERTDKDTEALFLLCFERREQLITIKGEPSGKDVHQRLAVAMAFASKKVQQALAEAHTALLAQELHLAFAAGHESLKPARVFELFSPYLMVTVDAGKQMRDPAYAKRAAIEKALVSETGWVSCLPAPADDEYRLRELKKLDPRWLDLAIEHRNMELIWALARPNHTALIDFLTQTFDELREAQEQRSWAYRPVLHAMIYAEHPAAVESLISVLASSDANSPGFWDVPGLIPCLPKSAIPRLEALLPTLPEATMDRVLDQLTRLKNRQ